MATEHTVNGIELKRWSILMSDEQSETRVCLRCKGKGYTVPVRHVSGERITKTCTSCNGLGYKYKEDAVSPIQKKRRLIIDRIHWLKPTVTTDEFKLKWINDLYDELEKIDNNIASYRVEDNMICKSETCRQREIDVSDDPSICKSKTCRERE